MAIEAITKTLASAQTPDAHAPSDDWLSYAQAAFATAIASYMKAVEKEARRDGYPWMHYRTTLAVAMSIGSWTLGATVGDAFLVAGTADRQVHLVMPPEKLGAYVNEVRLIAPGTIPTVIALFDPSVDGLVLSTDGLEKTLTERIVMKGSERSPVMWEAPRETFRSIIDEVRNGLSGEDLRAILATDQFRRLRGDDIGVAVMAT